MDKDKKEQDGLSCAICPSMTPNLMSTTRRAVPRRPVPPVRPCCMDLTYGTSRVLFAAGIQYLAPEYVEMTRSQRWKRVAVTDNYTLGPLHTVWSIQRQAGHRRWTVQAHSSFVMVLS